jgi:hypothetical protein
MRSGTAYPAILLLLGVALVFAGLLASRFELIVLGAIVAIAGAALGVLATRRDSGGPGGS